MGGTNDSGIGRRHGRQGVRRFTEPQTVAVQRGPPLAKPDWLPGELYERGLTAVIAALERFGRFG
jgi:succinate-semialdehyde dehydrogenase/glutarate-semialdehyde dehydrogenase